MRQRQRILVIGLGLLGGSVGLALQDAAGVEVHGYDTLPLHREEALALGLVHALWDPAAPPLPFHAVVLAMPPGSAGMAVAELRPWLYPTSLLMDVCSVKGPVIRAVREALGPFPGFLPAHPMAGSHLDGPRAAHKDLFRDRRVILTPLPETSREALAAGRALWETLGATTTELTPEFHDSTLALLSHLPHLLAFTLADQARGAGADTTLAGPAFFEATRLALCPVSLWADIVLENREAVLARLRSYRAGLEDLEALLDAGDRGGLTDRLARARAWKADHLPPAP